MAIDPEPAVEACGCGLALAEILAIKLLVGYTCGLTLALFMLRTGQNRPGGLFYCAGNRLGGLLFRVKDRPGDLFHGRLGRNLLRGNTATKSPFSPKLTPNPNPRSPTSAPPSIGVKITPLSK